MSRCRLLFAIVCVCVMATTAWAAKPAGLLAEWNFDEGRGDVAHDSTGHGHEAKVYGATWVKQGGGFAISFDGLDDYINLTAARKLDITGPISIETWIAWSRYRLVARSLKRTLSLCSQSRAVR